MKIPITTLILILLFTFSVVAQIKVDEYERTDSDSEGGHLDTFLAKIAEQPHSKGLIVVHSGRNGNSLGSALRDVNGIKRWIAFRSTERHRFNDRIFFRVTEGNSALFKEFWIYPEGTNLPITEPERVSLGNFNRKYLYASVCASCEPAVPELSKDFIDLREYANLLKRYPSHRGLIVITESSYKGRGRNESYKEAIGYGIRYRAALVGEHKIKNKISIKIVKSPRTNETPVLAEFYIVPNSLNR